MKEKFLDMLAILTVISTASALCYLAYVFPLILIASPCILLLPVIIVLSIERVIKIFKEKN